MRFAMRNVLLLMFCACLVGCSGWDSPNVTGSGVSSTEQREVAGFSQVELYGVGSLTVVAGDSPKLTIEADDNMLQYVKSGITAETLRVGVGPGTYIWNTGYPRITLQGGDVKGYALRGQTQLALNDADLDSLNLALDGQCSVTLSGTIDELTIDVSGQGVIDATNATIRSITGKLNGQSTLVCRDAADVKVQTHKDSVVKRVGTNEPE